MRLGVPLLCSLFVVLTGFAEGKIECHYCGIRKLCTLPYDPKTAEFINCPVSCMKFDGQVRV